ncbi:hypothetical protein QWY85_05870 [Neolewinella lacunae]|uniref:Uncharacterized protein n=1 Tax=Neolewinella lacunae TaxID=1517758 RepID=A0A923PMN1_9BACT|nr:hypothetical protein [Neolewinella lacunae]MBC6994486.1 hypothetical protein [Neolewinella lacunae]MDN3634179.1 hypothetical protein [Neolewinella lacunae]
MRTKLTSFLGPIASVLIVLGSTGCDDCPKEVKVSPDLDFNPSALQILDIFEPSELVFSDVDGNTISFNEIESFEGFEKLDQGRNRYQCDNGKQATGIYYRQRQAKSYLSSQGDKINLNMYSWNPLFVPSSGIIPPDTATGMDVLDVELIFIGCDTLRESRYLQFTDGTPNVYESGFSITKFGHAHSNLFSVGTLPYPYGIYLGHNKGIVAFDYCGKNWVQIP